MVLLIMIMIIGHGNHNNHEDLEITAPIITGPTHTSGKENHRHHSKAFLHLSEKIIVKNGDSRMSYDMVGYDLIMKRSNVSLII